MTREEFIEKVDDAYSAEYFKTRDWKAAIGVAIDIVLEEAAKTADDMPVPSYVKQCLADRIRALKGE